MGRTQPRPCARPWLRPSRRNKDTKDLDPILQDLSPKEKTNKAELRSAVLNIQAAMRTQQREREREIRRGGLNKVLYRALCLF